MELLFFYYIQNAYSYADVLYYTYVARSLQQISRLQWSIFAIDIPLTWREFNIDFQVLNSGVDTIHWDNPYYDGSLMILVKRRYSDDKWLMMSLTRRLKSIGPSLNSCRTPEDGKFLLQAVSNVSNLIYN